MNNDYIKQILDRPINDRQKAEFWVKRYVRFIEWCKSKNHTYNGKTNGTNIHHIVPRALGGSDDQSNLVVLTYKEHLVAHHILSKTRIKQTIAALYIMVNKHIDQFNYALSTRILCDAYTLQTGAGLVKRVINLTLGCTYESVSEASRELYNGKTVGITKSIQTHRKVAGCYLILENDLNGRTYQQCIDEFETLKLKNRRVQFKDPLVNITKQQVFNNSWDLQQTYPKYECRNDIMSFIKNKSKDSYGNYWIKQKDIPKDVSLEELQKQYESHNKQKEIDRKLNSGKKVLCIETMKVYNNATIAQTELNIHEGAIGNAIRTHRMTGGYHWMYYKDDLTDQDIKQYLDESEIGYDERATNRKAVVNLHTGREYLSQSDAANDIGVSVTTFSSQTKKHNKVNGQYYAYKDDVEEFGREFLLNQYQQERIQRRNKVTELNRHGSRCKPVK